MGDWTDNQDPYQVLGLTQGHESTEAEIKKAYRLLVLKKHPDKQKNNPNAAAEFHLLQKAFELLSDAKARLALDDLYKAKAARKAREAGQSEKRRKMREDLEKREGAWHSARSEEQKARNKLQEELDRLRRQNAERQASQAAYMAERMAFASSAAPSQPVPDNNASAADYQAQAPAESFPQPTEELFRTLKVTWDKKGSISYTIDQLRDIFSKHGDVEDVVQHTSKKKSKGSALVLMQTLDGARAASEAVNGSLPNPLLVVPLAKASAPAQGGTRSSVRSPVAPSAESSAHVPVAPTLEAQQQQQQQQEQQQQQQQQQCDSDGEASLKQLQHAQPAQQAHAAFPTGPTGAPLTPPSSPMKPAVVRNPFGGKLNPDEARGSGANSFSSFPAFSNGNGAASNSAASIFGSSAANAVNSSAANSFSSFPAFPSSAPIRPLFAAGSMRSSAGQNPSFGAGSYSSFPGMSAVGGQAQAAMQGAFAQVHAGAKRGFEDMTLLKLRQAADRAAAIEQLKAEDAGQ